MDYLVCKELYHHGIKGQKWGVRRFQNEDGSLTAEGEQRYGISGKDVKKYLDAEKKANQKVFDDWDSGSSEAKNNRHNAIEKDKAHLKDLQSKINSNSVLKNNNIEFKCEAVKGSYNIELAKCSFTNKKTGKTLTYEDPSDIQYTLTDDLIDLGVNQKDLMNSKDMKQLDQLLEDVNLTDMDLDGLQEDPHYGRDNIERKYDFGDLNKEQISKIQDALADLQKIRYEEIKTNTTATASGKQKALGALAVIGTASVAGLLMWLASKD